MVIRIFIFALLGLSILSYFIPVEDKTKKGANEDIALLTFKDSTMYTLTTDSMHRIVDSKEALRYKNRDVMYDGVLTLKGKDKNNKEITDVLFSDVIIKRGDDFKFLNNVKYRRDNYITLNTNELFYNDKTGIATNTLPFEGTYFNNYIKGQNIYLNLNKYHMKANKTHFEVEVEKK
ncbi:hypothetical protein [Arcobacter sp. LA11]|uniref:hypothetical protein n=1 Tax=Arcobacter sp. LA11 TaxID=1898176 RepID=UPI0009355DC0|nr:hypothetical protein [Arcobacter sp. LA11]